ncbi:MAG TPA: ABC transporter permease [Blastocatellia bacterium]|nr:ABC transporter permease [Blastocatellia bacterium]
MKTVDYLPLITKNSFRNRRRSLLTISSLAVSLCLLGVLMAMSRALFFEAEQSPAQAVRLVTHNKVSLAQPMPASAEQKIQQIQGVQAVSVRQWFGGNYRDARDTRNFFARFAVRPEKLFQIQSELIIPDDQKQAFLRQRTGCVASRDLANKFGWTPGERITITGDIWAANLELTLVGIFDDPDRNEWLFFNHDYLRESLPSTDPNRDLVYQILVQADRPEDVSSVGRAIDDLFANSPYPTKTESEQAFALSFVSFLGNLKLFLLAIAGAVTFAILLVSANTLSMSIRERIREVGILKTLGFTPAMILGTLLGEAAVLALIGGAVGSAFAWVLCKLISSAPTPVQQLKTLSVTPLITSLCLFAALLIGLASGMIPSVGASRKSILDSLRHTG